MDKFILFYTNMGERFREDDYSRMLGKHSPELTEEEARGHMNDWERKAGCRVVCKDNRWVVVGVRGRVNDALMGLLVDSEYAAGMSGGGTILPDGMTIQGLREQIKSPH